MNFDEYERGGNELYKKLAKAVRDILEAAAAGRTESADVLFSIGTSGIVYPAASIPSMAKRQGAYLVEINPEPTPLTDLADTFLRGLAGVILPALYQEVQSERQLLKG